MKRLREMSDDELSGSHSGLRAKAHRQASELLSAVEPLAASDERMHRVRRSMEQKRGARRSMLRGPRALALAAVLVFAFSTLAAAQSGVLRAMIARVRSVIELPTLVLSPRPKQARPASKRHEPAPVQQIAAPAATASTAGTAPQVEAIVVAPLATPEDTADVVQTSRAPVHAKRHSRASAAEDNELVRRAVKALRRDGDAAAAARMLEEAHVRSPHGTLAEEVMSLRVEAALARDDGRARKYAQEYLARYPQGRYRAQVMKALGQH
jgi:hypothetical protein